MLKIKFWKLVLSLNLGEEHEEHVQLANERRVCFTPTSKVKYKGINGIKIKF